MEPFQQQQQQPRGLEIANVPSQEDKLEQQTDDDMSGVLNEMLFATNDNYSIERLLERARDKKLSLRQLRDKLIQHQKQLHQTSLDLFNNNYDRFFRLSHLVACLQEPIQHVVQPIQNYRQQLDQLCQSHDEYLQNIDNKLATLEQTSRDKLLADKLVALIRRRDRIFEQIHQSTWLRQRNIELLFSQKQQQQQPQSSFKVNLNSIERLYEELKYLTCEVCSIQPTSDELLLIKKTLESSVSEQIRRIDEWFTDIKTYLNESSTSDHQLPAEIYAREMIERASKQLK